MENAGKKSIDGIDGNDLIFRRLEAERIESQQIQDRQLLRVAHRTANGGITIDHGPCRLFNNARRVSKSENQLGDVEITRIMPSMESSSTEATSTRVSEPVYANSALTELFTGQSSGAGSPAHLDVPMLPGLTQAADDRSSSVPSSQNQPYFNAKDLAQPAQQDNNQPGVWLNLPVELQNNQDYQNSQNVPPTPEQFPQDYQPDGTYTPGQQPYVPGQQSYNPWQQNNVPGCDSSGNCLPPDSNSAGNILSGVLNSVLWNNNQRGRFYPGQEYYPGGYNPGGSYYTQDCYPGGYNQSYLSPGTLIGSVLGSALFGNNYHNNGYYDNNNDFQQQRQQQLQQQRQQQQPWNQNQQQQQWRQQQEQQQQRQQQRQQLEQQQQQIQRQQQEHERQQQQRQQQQPASHPIPQPGGGRHR